jgi:hypothetical protein
MHGRNVTIALFNDMIEQCKEYTAIHATQFAMELEISLAIHDNISVPALTARKIYALRIIITIYLV